MDKLHTKINEHNRDLVRKNSLLALQFKPMSFQLAPSCFGFTLLTYSCLSLINHSAPRITTEVTVNITQSMFPYVFDRIDLILIGCQMFH